MTDQIHIEPDGPQRPAFAAWGLAQDPPLQTATASGWDIPIGLYPDVPPELLEGAYVDGFLYGRPDAPQPVARVEVPTEVVGPVTPPSKPQMTDPRPRPLTTEAKKRRTRRQVTE